MNEASTRAELIDPLLKQAGWGVEPGTQILREQHITQGRITAGQAPQSKMIADYILVSGGRKVAVIEAKSIEKAAAEGVAQAKLYAQKLDLPLAFACNGREIYQMQLQTGHEATITAFPTPTQLNNVLSGRQNEWQARFNAVPFETVGGSRTLRFYQEVAVNRALEHISKGDTRILLTLATGTGKTFIAFQLVWKLFQSRWNLQFDGKRQPRILFLADRNILANQAINAFSAFNEDAKCRIEPQEIRRNQQVPKNASIFFTIFQTFLSGPNESGYFGEYAPDFFDLIIVDECHRGGANDEGTWRKILEHFKPAVQIGLTATPKRKDNVDTYEYFGNPVYTYSLKEGIEDGFLTPFRVRRLQTTLDEYRFAPDDVIEGEIDDQRTYEEPDFNRLIEIRAREAKRVDIFMSEIDRTQKTLVFCATQAHAAVVRDLISQAKVQLDGSAPANYCVRVTANDGELGEQFLREFQDNEKTTPTVLTTSQKLSTGVDALNIRNIVLMRPVNSMIEFKQIVGRGTRLYEGKEYFTIYDFVNASKMFADPEWDGEPEQPVEVSEASDGVRGKTMAESKTQEQQEIETLRRMVRVTLANGKERLIQYMGTTLFYGPDGRPLSAQEFVDRLKGQLPRLFDSETSLLALWSLPDSRQKLLDQLTHEGFAFSELAAISELLETQDCDLVDTLRYLAYSLTPLTRLDRAKQAQNSLAGKYPPHLQEFLEYVLYQYVERGESELAETKLPRLLELKYKSIQEAEQYLGKTEAIREAFIGFQSHLYRPNKV